MKEIMENLKHMNIKTVAIYSVACSVIGVIVTGAIMIFKKRRSSEDK